MMDTSLGLQFVGEILGTFILILFGGGVVAGVVLDKTKSNNAGWVVITIAWGLAVAMGAYVSGYLSLAHLNPALTLGLAFAGEFPWANVPAYIAGQFIGAFLGATIVWLHYYPHWKATKDQGAKLGVFATGPAIRHYTSNLFGETVGTFALVFGIMSIGANEISAGLNPLIVGSLIVVIGMALGGTTGYAINPARDLGPRIMHAILPISGKGSSDWAYSWVPVVGPILGATIAATAYNAIINHNVSVWLYVSVAVLIVFEFIAMSMDKKQA
ncbi:MIP/aquaporin family protein [Brochothrix thermosphacta]|uniref:MIP/aquaporin family protein n=1 Tax=Brochothrix thermosphacta TaxID=2756 RepID=UPI00083F57A6|nr:MIP/aquaporin family protein [Brochothrix thermosphacta]ODJ64157.1 aquaporin [Brochothrix thermosphacta]ODJ64597.1 aquaporin [Brochothrix thermosphacta]